MKYLSLFSGYGGFELGIQQAYEQLRTSNEVEQRGCGQKKSELEATMPLPISESLLGQHPDCIGFSEIDKYATQVYKQHFNHKEYGDITKIDATTLPNFDLLVGGFPCQSFSIAGKRRGFTDTRGTLFFEIARIIKEKQPHFLLLENVKGLLSHAKGDTFKTIIRTLNELGYAVEWQVLNAKNFGVPQNRERVFIIGHLGGFGGRQVFPIGAIDKVGVGENENKVSSTLTSCYWKELSGGRQGLIEKTKNVSQGYRVYDPSGISTTLAGQAGGIGAKTGLYEVKAVLTPDRPNKRQNGRRIKENGEPSFTLTGQDKHGVMINTRIRRLTPTECERLMGLPDGWTEGVSDTQRYKLCGNGVVVNVVKEIMIRLIKNYTKI